MTSNNKKLRQKGVALLEAALLVALVSLIGAVSVKALGVKVNDKFESVRNAVGAGDICVDVIPTPPECAVRPD